MAAFSARSRQKRHQSTDVALAVYTSPLTQTESEDAPPLLPETLPLTVLRQQELIYQQQQLIQILLMSPHYPFQSPNSTKISDKFFENINGI